MKEKPAGSPTPEEKELDPTGKASADRNVSQIVRKVFAFTAQHGGFGMQTIDALHEKVPPSICKMSGNCCFSIRMYSIEYHRIITYLCENFSVDEITEFIRRTLDPSDRIARYGEDVRYRCVFLHPETKKCRIYHARPFMCRAFGHGFFGQVECPHVAVATPTTTEHYVGVSGRVASVSEQFHVATDEGLEPMEAFPFEFWLRRAIDGSEKALDWFQETHFYKKYTNRDRSAR